MDMVSHWQDVFNKHLHKDAERVFGKYPKFWGRADDLDEMYDNVTAFLPGNGKDVTALLLYYRAEANSKDTKRIFTAIARETIEHHGYGIEQSHFLAVWWFITVLLPEYELKHKITDQTDLSGMYQCYLNTGEIDYEHDWSS